MKPLFLSITILLTLFLYSQKEYSFKIQSYISYQAEGKVDFNSVISKSFNTIEKEYKQNIYINIDEEYNNVGYIVSFSDTGFFESQKNIQNYKKIGNTITFDFNHYEWTEEGYLPTIKKTIKFSEKNSFSPIIYFYDPKSKSTFLVKYNVSESN